MKIANFKIKNIMKKILALLFLFGVFHLQAQQPPVKFALPYRYDSFFDSAENIQRKTVFILSDQKEFIIMDSLFLNEKENNNAVTSWSQHTK